MREIQDMLAKAGYLKEPPNGEWDTATRDAMRQFQQANGFAATGLPEAKALMKLGLGPHPLPRGLAGNAPSPAEQNSAGEGPSSETPAAAAQAHPPQR